VYHGPDECRGKDWKPEDKQINPHQGSTIFHGNQLNKVTCPMCGEKGHVGLQWQQCPSVLQLIPTNYGQWLGSAILSTSTSTNLPNWQTQPQQLIPFQTGTNMQIKPPRPPSARFSGNTASLSGPQINTNQKEGQGGVVSGGKLFLSTYGRANVAKVCGMEIHRDPKFRIENAVRIYPLILQDHN
jgi:hypothetical protein